MQNFADIFVADNKVGQFQTLYSFLLLLHLFISGNRQPFIQIKTFTFFSLLFRLFKFSHYNRYNNNATLDAYLQNEYSILRLEFFFQGEYFSRNIEIFYTRPNICSLMRKIFLLGLCHV